MKKFKFGLQSILDLREKRLEEKQIEFGKLQFVMRTLENQLNNLKEEYSVSKNNLTRLLTDCNHIDINLISVNQRYLLKVEDNIASQQRIIAEHKIVLENKQKEMLEALKEKTMLEKLKEKQFKAFMKEIDETEKKELDEIGLTRYAR